MRGGRRLVKAGAKPVLGKDNEGDPMIDTDHGQLKYTIYFYGCEQHVHCDSLRFEVVFPKDAHITNDVANRWNAGQRFIQAAVKPDGRLVLSYDVATIGGLTDRNFADVVDWWGSQLDALPGFFSEVFTPESKGKAS